MPVSREMAVKREETSGKTRVQTRGGISLKGLKDKVFSETGRRERETIITTSARGEKEWKGLDQMAFIFLLKKGAITKGTVTAAQRLR